MCKYIRPYLLVSRRIIEGSLEVTLQTKWTDGTAEVGRESEKRREEETRSEQRKSQRKEDAGARKGRKVVKHCVFPMLVAPEGRKVHSTLAKAAGAEPPGQMRDEKVHAAVARSTFRSQNIQNTPFLKHIWKLTCRKSARRCGASTFRSQNAKNTLPSEQFWKLRCSKSVRRCGAKQNTPFSEHFWKLRERKVHAVATRSTFPSQHVQNTPTSEHFWKLR